MALKVFFNLNDSMIRVADGVVQACAPHRPSITVPWGAKQEQLFLKGVEVGEMAKMKQKEKEK